MDLEELKQNWHKAQINIEHLKEDNRRLARQLSTGRAQTARDKLASYYLRSSIGALLLPLLYPAIVSVLKMPEWYAACYAAFGIIMCILSIWFHRYIKRCDYTSVSTVEALKAAISIARYQRYIRTFGIITGGLLALSMFVQALGIWDDNMFIGFLIGLIFGLFFGVIKWCHMSALVRQMKNELESLLEDKNQNL